MPAFFRSRPTRSLASRLSLVVVAAVATTTLIMIVLSMWRETTGYMRALESELTATAQVFAAATAEATAQGDRQSALYGLRAIARLPNIVFAQLETKTGKHLAEVGTATVLVNDLDLSEGRESWTPHRLLTSQHVTVEVPVIKGGREVGRLTLVADNSALGKRLRQTAFAILTAGGIALAVGLLIAFRLRHSIVSPIASLASGMQAVRETHNYETGVELDRARRTSSTEIVALVDGFNAMIADIRERDRQLVEHRDRLEIEVADRTADLERATAAAQAANRAKSDFLATMSHEIRTPMNGVLVMADLLSALDLPPRPRRYAEVIARSGRSLVSIINDILDFSKIEAGHLDLEEIPVDLVDVCENVVGLFSERAGSKDLDLAAALAPDLPARILGDPTRLGQILSNLVNNALKFTEEGHVLIAAGRAGENGETLALTVSDTGIGISAEKLQSVFSAFTQADQSTTREYGGTGLGLAITRRLVDAMGGTIAIESEPGRGTTFTVTLPLRVADEGKAPERFGLRVFYAIEGTATRLALTKGLKALGCNAIGVATNARLIPGKADLAIVDAGAAASGLTQNLRGRAGAIVHLARLGETTGDRLHAEGTVDAVFSAPLTRADLAILVARVACGEPIEAPDTARSNRSTLPTFAGRRALIADDGAVNREVAIEALARLGITADAVNNGRDAVAATEARSYDIVLMDGSMPEMDGFEATRTIRAREDRNGSPRVLIVALTAHVVGAAAEAWRSAGMDDILHKPFTVEALAACLSRFLTPGDTHTVAHDDANEAPHEPSQEAPSSGEPVQQPLPAVSEQGCGEEIPVIDPDTLTRLQHMASNGQTDFVARVFNLYREHAPAAVADLEALVDSDDLAEIVRISHALKSMSYNIGAARVAALCTAIEHGARQEDATMSAIALADLKARVAEALDVIDRFEATARGTRPQPAAAAT